MAFKEKVKANYNKNPKATASVGLLATAAVGALIGVLTGIIEPETAINSIVGLFNLMAVGG